MVRLESLEGRALLADVSFAVVGDYGWDGAGEADVANRIRSWDPDFVVTVGDNNYPAGEAATIDRNVGKHYASFIAPYSGAYGPGSPGGVNRFFPALGNHDWDAAGARPYLDYFSLPGNERYYTVVQGPVQLFVLDSDPREPDLGYTGATVSTENSVQGQWLKGALAASTAAWKVVVLHHAPYTSGVFNGNSGWMQWPYQQWGASAVLAGHDHHYERILKGGLPYFVNGVGGAELRFNLRPTPEPGSAARYGADYGAMKVDANDTAMTFQFVTRWGAVVDTYTLNKNVTPPAAPAAPTNLSAVAVSGTRVDLSWRDNANNETNYKIERSTDGRNFYPLAGTGANGTGYANTGLTAGKRYFYRVYAVNGAGASVYSNVAEAVTGAPTGPTPPASPGALVASAVSASAINLTWADNSNNETGFRIERSADGVSFAFLANVGANVRNYAHTGLAASTKVYYRVQAIGSPGNSGYSNVASATTAGVGNPNPGVPAAPTNLAVAVSTSVANAVNLSWRDNAGNESGYKIERSTDGRTFYALAGTGANGVFSRNTGLTPGKRYYYRVFAWNGVGASGLSNVVSVVVPSAAGAAVPGAPAALVIEEERVIDQVV